MGGIQGFPPFVHTTHSQGSATTIHSTTSSDHDFSTFLSFFGNMYHGKKWLGATDGGAGSSMMMMRMNFEHSASASLFGYGANRANPTPLLGALVQNAQGGDATRAGSKYEQRGRWNYVNLGTCWLTFFPCSRAPSGDGGWAPTSRLHVAGV